MKRAQPSFIVLLHRGCRFSLTENDEVYMIHLMKRRNMHFSDEQLVALNSLSRKTGLSVAELVRRAVDIFIRQEILAAKSVSRPVKKQEK